MATEQRELIPIWLCSSAVQGHGRQVLVNLSQKVPEGFDAYERVIEVVSQEDTDRQSARLRWKYYSEGGYDIVRHDLNLAS
jgi:DNA polymerase III subunit chi